MIELREKKFLLKILNDTRNIRFFNYKIYNLLSIKCDRYKNIYLDYSSNIDQKKEFNDIDENNINRRFEDYKKELIKNLTIFHKDLLYLAPINNRSNHIELFKENLYNYYKEKSKVYKLSEHYNKIIQLNDLLIILIKNSISMELDFFVRAYIKNDRRNNYLKTSPKMEEILRANPIKKSIDNYLAKLKSSSSIARTGISDEIQIYDNIKFKIFLKYQFHIINIKLNKFLVSLQLPFNKKDLLKKNFKFKLNIEEILFEKEEKMYLKSNIKEGELLIYKKLHNLFEHRFESIENIIYLEKIKDNSDYIKKNEFIYDNDFLIQLVERFIEYIRDYNTYNIFKIKCPLCNKCAKYSFVEKCFLPPFYKIYKENISLKNKDKKPNYFYHEECFKSLALPNL